MKSIKKATQATPVIAGATSIVALFAASSLDAGIIVSVQGATVRGGVAAIDFDWDIDGVGGAELTIANYSSGYTSTYIGIKDFANGFEVRTVDRELGNLATGVAVGSINFAASTFAYLVSATGLSASATLFSSGVTGYIGFKFEPELTPLYGWAEVVLVAGSFELVQWAYEDSGNDIIVGAIPEPAGAATGLGLLALGAAGLRRMRRPKSA